MARRDLGFVDAFLDRMADEILTRITERAGFKRGGAPRGRGPSKLRGRKLHMTCRYPGCKNRSKGPRFSFLCETHLKNKKASLAAIKSKG